MLPMFIDFKASIDRMEKNGVITETSVNKLGVLKHRISIMVWYALVWSIKIKMLNQDKDLKLLTTKQVHLERLSCMAIRKMAEYICRPVMAGKRDADLIKSVCDYLK